jgi:vacuolar-type H+-ATPase subunit F/Vma7
MNYVVRALCTPETASAFALAGVATTEADPTKDLDATVAELAADPRLAVLLIEQSLNDRLSEEAKKRFARQPLPMLVPFPDATWADGPVVDDYVLELLRRAIGYRVRLK